MSQKNLRRIRLTYERPKSGIYKQADLSNSYFEGSHYKDCDFRNAILDEFSFHDVNLSYADLQGAKEFTLGRCKNVIFYETMMPDGSIRTDRDELEI